MSGEVANVKVGGMFGLIALMSGSRRMIETSATLEIRKFDGASSFCCVVRSIDATRRD